jgi:hypothetical protein
LRRAGGRRVEVRFAGRVEVRDLLDEPDDREGDRDEDLAGDLADLAVRAPLPPRVLPPLEFLEAAVRFAILHTVVGLHHMSHSCHTAISVTPTS